VKVETVSTGNRARRGLWTWRWPPRRMAAHLARRLPGSAAHRERGACAERCAVTPRDTLPVKRLLSFESARS